MNLFFSICFTCRRTMVSHRDKSFIDLQAERHRAWNPGHVVEVDTSPGPSHCKRCGENVDDKTLHGARYCRNWLADEVWDPTIREMGAA